jgi:predicted Zn-dependent protease
MSHLISTSVREELWDESVQWDVYSQIATDTEVHFRDNKIETIRSPIRSQGYAIRIITKKKNSLNKKDENEEASGVGIATGNLLDDDGDVRKTLKLAIEASKITKTPFYQIPSEKTFLPTVKISDPKITKDQFGAAKEIAERVIALLDAEKNIRVTFCKIRLTEIATQLENCYGLLLQKRETFAYFEAGLSPTSNKSRDESLAEYWPHVLVRQIEDLELEKNIPDWTRFSRDSSRARTPETGKYALIVPSQVLSEMLPPVVSFHSSASSLKRRMTRWRTKGEKVWNDKVTLNDNGLLDYGLATSPFDDEGIPQQETSIITCGEFKNYIANNMYAKLVSPPKSTGNAVKSSRLEGVLCYNDGVDIGHTNIEMDGGDSDLEEMIRETKKGILIEQFSWMIPDPITGSFGAEIRHAYLVENGKAENPIKGGVVNGSFFDAGGVASGDSEKGVFNSLDLVSKKRQKVNASLLPYVRFPEIRISGR